MTTKVGILKKAISSLIKEGLLSEGCPINEKTWKAIQDRVTQIQKGALQ